MEWVAWYGMGSWGRGVVYEAHSFHYMTVRMQTGTGKTHTMEGSGLEDPEECGIIPRSVIRLI